MTAINKLQTAVNRAIIGLDKRVKKLERQERPGNTPLISVQAIEEVLDIGTGVEERVLLEPADIVIEVPAGALDTDADEYVVPEASLYWAFNTFLIGAEVSHPNRSIVWTFKTYLNSVEVRSTQLALSADNPVGSLEIGTLIELAADDVIHWTISHDDGATVSAAGSRFTFSLYSINY